jgi:hypothetical protein
MVVTGRLDKIEHGLVNLYELKQKNSIWVIEITTRFNPISL